MTILLMQAQSVCVFILLEYDILCANLSAVCLPVRGDEVLVL